MSNEANAALEAKIKELTNVHRIVSNGINWLSDVEVKVAYIAPVNEFMSFLQGFQKSLSDQKTVLEAAVPKPEEVEEAAGQTVA